MSDSELAGNLLAPEHGLIGIIATVGGVANKMDLSALKGVEGNYVSVKVTGTDGYIAFGTGAEAAIDPSVAGMPAALGAWPLSNGIAESYIVPRGKPFLHWKTNADGKIYVYKSSAPS
jgi:hypothetical protein